ncbi:DUF1302 domain-containing protein [Pseudomonas sp. H9]|uniref:DUF1302 domain-containing protein n=1 Tax=Pseudomonas sp. H9 TaxID=483968 RepID=UPI0010578F32|nr:DUF1302 domain-containing protein [Pseudomonas sp. H9]TDF82615.1 DUF1302 domain-containing protein [Pseudomonas sp. H9]
MSTQHTRVLGRVRETEQRFCLSRLFVALLGCTVVSGVQAFDVETGNPDLKLRFDTNVKYSNAWRVKDRQDKLVADANLDDGDRNFDKGLISNRLDLFSEFDVSYQKIGARVSGAAWYDDVYNQGNDNNSPQTINSYSVRYDQFTKDTRDLHGRQAEFRDAFVYANYDIGDDMWGVTRVGQHSLVYGESLFFGGNAIAAGQQPIDAVRALTVPNSQFKELGLPVNQISTQLQITPTISVGGYYQFEWDRTRIPGAGSYFSPADLLDEGGERIVLARLPNGVPAASFYRGKDIEARDSGQWGVQLRYRSEALDTEFGLYAINYHDKNFQTQVRPGVGAGARPDQVGDYMLVFPEDIRAYGFSANRGFGDVNVAFETSVRDNAPLVSLTMTDLVGNGDNDSNPLYAVGRTAHAQTSMIYIMPTSTFWDTAALLGELAWNRRLSVEKNQENLDPNGTRDATAIRLAFTPTYFQVFDGVDLSVPMGVSYGIDGRSSAVGGFSQAKGGDYNIGLTADYLKSVTFTLAYNGYYGPSAPININGIKTFKQTNADRDFISFSVSHTF